MIFWDSAELPDEVGDLKFTVMQLDQFCDFIQQSQLPKYMCRECKALQFT
ncbi:hypothetical protein GCM10017783_26310 [Deinococcus piscis]|uniref:Transposase n=1 Tax=Deinococcus piscis TaxID=394230 RepID=A0ABQ3KF18_9DEIO|nr:hypothetical protein GCM10017783_26310 [Deinococcus piscis]